VAPALDETDADQDGLLKDQQQDTGDDEGGVAFDGIE
jgi:hypothetical protein